MNSQWMWASNPQAAWRPWGVSAWSPPPLLRRCEALRGWRRGTGPPSSYNCGHVARVTSWASRPAFQVGGPGRGLCRQGLLLSGVCLGSFPEAPCPRPQAVTHSRQACALLPLQASCVLPRGCWGRHPQSSSPSRWVREESRAVHPAPDCGVGPGWQRWPGALPPLEGSGRKDT